MYYINLLTNKSAVQFKHNPIQIINEISKILNSFAILPNLAGYQFLHYGIWLCFIKENEYINNISEKLYPDIAEKFFTSSERVEIAINNALNRYSKNAPQEIYKKFSLPNNPDPSAFIAKAANKLIADNKNYFQ